MSHQASFRWFVTTLRGYFDLTEPFLSTLAFVEFVSTTTSVQVLRYRCEIQLRRETSKALDESALFEIDLPDKPASLFRPATSDPV